MENLRSLVYSAFDSDPAPIVNFLHWLAAQHHLPADLHLLDVGSGPGRMLGEYVKLGWRVTGLEIDEVFYEQARVVAAELEGALVLHGGFTDLETDSQYHLIAAVNSPFAYLLNQEEQRQALARSFRALHPGGVLFLDIPNLIWFMKHERSPIVREAEVDGSRIRFLERHEYDFHDALYVQHNEYKVTRPDGAGFTLRNSDTHLITTPPELLRLVAGAGFEAIHTYNSYDARRPERLHGRYILLSARKPVQMR
jgi:SAM-dependent methyltransferase